MPVPSERKLQCYPPINVLKLVQGLAAQKKMTESAATTHALQGFFNSLPERERERILKAATQQKPVSKNSY